MAKGIVIRDGRPEDEAAVLSLWSAAYQDGGGHRDLADLRRLLAGVPGARLLVAVTEGAVRATLIAAFDGWRGNMYTMAVAPAYQRRGIAGALVREGEVWLRSLGCSRITALVELDHEWATAFWRSAGYDLDEGMGRYHRNL